jgi:alpha-N-arabinofuranosidase
MSAALRALIEIDVDEIIGEIHPHVYGHFIEHLDGCVYGGLWDSERQKFRDDVLALAGELRIPILRYPGGCFADGYHWRDGVGPRDQRPTRFDRAWNVDDPNFFGTDEFIRCCRLLDAEPYLCANFGSGTPEEAAAWVEYCNGPADSEHGALRSRFGRVDPYGVKYWGIGNEICLEGEIGHCDAANYARRYLAFRQAMADVDPGLKFVAVGWHDDIADWNPEVLRVAGGEIDYLAIHHYLPGLRRDHGVSEDQLYHAIVAANLDVEKRLAWVVAGLDEAQREHGRRPRIAFDEWNVAPPHRHTDDVAENRSYYTMRDGVFAAAFLNSMHRFCRDVTMANLAQLVNLLPAIVAVPGRAWATPVYWAVWLHRRHALELAGRATVECDTFAVPETGNVRAMDAVPWLDVSPTFDAARSRLGVCVVNRHRTADVRAEIALRGFEPVPDGETWTLSGPDALSRNLAESPDTVAVAHDTLNGLAARFQHTFPAHSATILTALRR